MDTVVGNVESGITNVDNNKSSIMINEDNSNIKDNDTQNIASNINNTNNSDENVADGVVTKQRRNRRSKKNKKNKQKFNENNNTESQKGTPTQQNSLLNNSNPGTNDNNDSNVKSTVNNQNVVVIKQKRNSNVDNSKKIKEIYNKSNNQKPIQIRTIDAIMMEQIINSATKEEDFETLNGNEDELLQHMLLESFVQQKQNDQNTIDNNSSNANVMTNVNTNIDVKINANTNVDTSVNPNTDNTIANNENEKLLNGDCDQLDNDYLIALALQQNENVEQKKMLSKMHSNSKHCKVSTTSVPNSFYVDYHYDAYNNHDATSNENNIRNDNGTNEYDNDNDNTITNGLNLLNINNKELNITQNKIEPTSTNFGPSHVFTSGTSLRHDSTVWNRKYVERLNQYDVFGNLNDKELHFNPRSYNSFRNSLEKKGFKKFEGPMIESRKRH